MRRKVNKTKRDRFEFYKASQYRSSWRTRCKKKGGRVEEVPSRQEIQDWLEAKKPWRCYLTKQLLTKTFQADHKQPISRGGGYSLKNVDLTSKRLNLAKGDMTVKEFKSLLRVLDKWEDKGKTLLSRLVASNRFYRR